MRKHAKKPVVSIISMGCSKNLVDSERLARQFDEAGFDVQFDRADNSDYIVVNTCGFIGDAKEESIEKIMDAIAAKEAGHVKAIYVMGCLSERYRTELLEELPEVDKLYGKFDWTGMVRDLTETEKAAVAKPWDRNLSTPGHYTYLKIAEGCNRFCAFCAIPIITGRYKSRPIDELCEEVSEMVSRGVKEFNVIAQDLSDYGKDMADGKSHLAELLERLAAIEGVEMIRLHYAYPADFPFDILPVMASHDNICNYLDIALQHIDDGVLKNMRRHINAEETRALLARIRSEVPGIHIRTTLMVGFPGEDDAAFRRLLDFVKEQKFERMGAFAYCEEDDTYAAKHFSDDIPDNVKQARLDELMRLQQDIAFETAADKKGRVLKVIIDELTDGYYVGRTEFDSPEVDCCVFIPKEEDLRIGDIYKVEITGSEGFDLYGRVIR